MAARGDAEKGGLANELNGIKKARFDLCGAHVLIDIFSGTTMPQFSNAVIAKAFLINQ